MRLPAEKKKENVKNFQTSSTSRSAVYSEVWEEQLIPAG